MWFVRRLVGPSMTPSLQPGWLLVCRRAQPKAGQIAVANVAGREVIKRVQAVTKTGLVLVGDNQDQSLAYQITRSQLKGKLVFCLWPLKRVK